MGATNNNKAYRRPTAPEARLPAPISIPTEPIGSISGPVDLIERVAKGDSKDPSLALFYEDAIRDTIKRFEATGSLVVTDGEQRKYHNFATYFVHELPNTAPDGFKIPFLDGHVRRLPRLTRGPFRLDVYYTELLLSLFELKAENFYIALAGEQDRRHALKIIRKYREPDQRDFAGVTAPVDPRFEAPEKVRDRSNRQELALVPAARLIFN